MQPPPGEKLAGEPTDHVLTAGLPEVVSAEAVPLSPGGRISRRRWYQICIAVIVLGLTNYLAYTVAYALLGGDAPNGRREIVTQADGSRVAVHTVRGHFIRSLDGRGREVSQAAWVYSYVHSITVPVTWGAVLLSMLVLARPHIVATMRGGLISGQAFVRGFGVLVVLVSTIWTLMFIWDFVRDLSV